MAREQEHCFKEDVLIVINRRRKDLGYRKYTSADVQNMKTDKFIPLIVESMIFDLSSYVSQHPGGEYVIKLFSAKDATDQFFKLHSKKAHFILAQHFFGDLVAATDSADSIENDSFKLTLSPRPATDGGQNVGSESAITMSSGISIESIQFGMHSSLLDKKLSDKNDGVPAKKLKNFNMEDCSYPHADLQAESPYNTHGIQGHLDVLEEEPELEDQAEEEAKSSDQNGFPRNDVISEDKVSDWKDGKAEKQVLTLPLEIPHPHLDVANSDKMGSGSCPFLALTAMQGSDKEVIKSALKDAEISEKPSRPKTQGSSRSSSRGLGSFASGSFAQFSQLVNPGLAVESPRSIRSRGDISLMASSRNASTINTGVDGSYTIGSRRSIQGTNLRSAGGVFRGHHQRKRRAHNRVSKTFAVNQDEWKHHSKYIVSSWKALLKKVSYSDLGTAIYESVRDNEVLEPLFRFTNRAVQGTKFVDMLSSIVDNIDSPNEIYKKIADLAPMHHRKGVKASHMPQMQEIVLSVFRLTLGDELKTEELKAWIWIWQYLSKALDQSLVEVGSTLGIVRDSWESILERYIPADLGEMVYDCLFRLAPNVATLFNKPREYMAVKMGDTLGMLVTWLGLRHVNYNVRPHHIPLIGPVFLNVLSEVSGEEWTHEVEKAWGVVFRMVCENMSEAIQDGEDYASSLEHTASYLTEHVDAANLKTNLEAELLTLCPSMFENKKTQPEENKEAIDRLQSYQSNASSADRIRRSRRGSVATLRSASMPDAPKNLRPDVSYTVFPALGVLTCESAQSDCR
eukprot:768729-Hanusia_phi.AAC.2